MPRASTLAAGELAAYREYKQQAEQGTLKEEGEEESEEEEEHPCTARGRRPHRANAAHVQA